MRILVVEDDQEIAQFLEKVLKEDRHAVDMAADGITGENMAAGGDYDLIILDIMLPRKLGYQVMRELRGNGLETPVLMLTAKGEVGDRVEGLDAGADDYLVKPFAVAELRARVRALLRRTSAQKSSILTIGSLTLDTASHQVLVAESEIELTRREFAILYYLLQNKGRLLSKGMIADHVWEHHFDHDYNLIEVYIRRLRQKLETPVGTKFIYTIRNSGYILREPPE